jgi:hypothetical protein
MPRLIDVTNQRFGRLVVTRRVAVPGQRPQWMCNCDCGKTSIARTGDLRSGRHRSCGCLRTESITKHGGWKTLTYSSWMSMRDRCFNPNSPHYDRYGGRGITICKRWQSFAHFRDDLGERPSARHTLERVNNDGNYEPSNCRWATRLEQSYNRSFSRILTIDDRAMCVAEWATELNWPQDRIRSRLKLGWSDRQALGFDPPPPSQNLSADDIRRVVSMYELGRGAPSIARAVGCGETTVYRTLDRVGVSRR